MKHQPDPNFPDRPNHEDFWRLSESLIYNDEQTEKNGVPLPEFLGVDSDSLLYVATQRGLRASRFLVDAKDFQFEAMLLINSGKSNLMKNALASHGAAWIDGFATGLEYQKRRMDGNR